MYPKDLHTPVDIPLATYVSEIGAHFVFSDPWEQFEKILGDEAVDSDYDRYIADDAKPSEILENFISWGPEDSENFVTNRENTAFGNYRCDNDRRDELLDARVTNDHWERPKDSNLSRIRNTYVVSDDHESSDFSDLVNPHSTTENTNTVSTDSSISSNYDSVHSLPEILPEESDISNLKHEPIDHVSKNCLISLVFFH